MRRLAFNALPGTLTDDMWAHQYNQEPNQVECSLHHKPWVSDGPESNLFGLEPNFGCCTANYHQGWPKFAASLFFLSGETENGRARGTGGCRVCAVRSSHHAYVAPLSTLLRKPTIRFGAKCKSPSARQVLSNSLCSCGFPHGRRALQSPSTASANLIQTLVRSRGFSGSGNPATALKLRSRCNRASPAGSMIPLPSNAGRWCFRTALAKSWVKLRDRGMTADWQVYPTTPWNYALLVDPDDPRRSITVSESEVSDVPFSRKMPPVQLGVKARKLTAWRAEDGVANTLPQSPVTSGEAEEEITLFPYATAKLRITAFPILKM